ncbi:HAD-IIIA family hydrolase [Cryobacterium sp.]|jgi:D-glycero-D-manno-heptose 1,7-bisphosphate phosphatase|uniref:D-glycero-alpha-D-manno-heptose-1,7-bisphosphate 7-phosphatase n=1 Tax=Cryobacterium sp. TaxID=1926290 RepID=UPI0026021D0A|nr:HAD-IIIA family hydrolase [Cryobacterium sp.]MCU1446073.1 haloacid dehalogenase [Cryobacterium sp.]
MTDAGFAGTRAVLFDRDGTLVVDVPYNGDPRLVEPMPTAIRALRLLRRCGLMAGVITNQSGVARGLLTLEDTTSVNRRVDEIFGGFDVWCVCPHAADAACACRKPKPGLVLTAAGQLGLRPTQVVVIGDIGSDVAAAAAAGARSILVPTRHTRFGEILDAPVVAPDLLSAVDALVADLPGGRVR